VLGIVAFALPLIALIVSLAAMLPMVPMLQEFFVTAARTGSEPSQEVLTQAILKDFPMAGVLLNLASLLGLAGLVTGIVAVVKKAGRSWGIGAIVLAVLAPVILGMVIGVMLAGALA